MTNRVVFITGASSGIGRASALAFARKGFHVAGTARRIDRLESLQKEINELPAPHGDFLPLEGDVADRQAVESAVKRTVETFGRLDILVANAGVGHRGALVDSDWDEMEILLRTNMDGVLHSIRACVPEMRKHHGGHIMIISSVAFNIVSPFAAIYAGSKAFVSSIANSLRLELENDNIKVTDFRIGRVQTEFNENRLGEGKRSAGGLPTLTPEQVAEAIINAVDTSKKTVVIRFFDRLVILGSTLIPGIMGRLARKQYK